MEKLIGLAGLAVVAYKVIYFILASMDALNSCGVFEVCKIVAKQGNDMLRIFEDILSYTDEDIKMIAFVMEYKLLQSFTSEFVLVVESLLAMASDQGNLHSVMVAIGVLLPQQYENSIII